MRIAVFSDTFYPQVNGVVKTLGKLQHYLESNNYEYRFFVPDTGDRFHSQNALILPSLPFPLYSDIRAAIPRYSLVRSSLLKFKPDLVHLVTPFTLGLLGLKYARQTGVPIVSSYHTNFPQYLAHYHLDVLEEPLWHYLRWFHSFSSLNLCPSQETLKELERNGIARLDLWTRGIDGEGFSPGKRCDAYRSSICPDGEAMLLYVGRLAPEKDLNTLVKAIQILNHKDVPCKLVLVGDGPSRSGLEGKQVENIIFAGYQSGEALRKIYASADIFAFPSSTETYGNVILEAMSSGLPVVGAWAGGVKENLIAGYNGLAFQPGNASEMAAAIQQLIDEPNLRLQLERGALEHSRSRSWDEVFRDLFAKYHEVIQENQQKYHIPA